MNWMVRMKMKKKDFQHIPQKIDLDTDTFKMEIQIIKHSDSQSQTGFIPALVRIDKDTDRYSKRFFSDNYTDNQKDCFHFSLFYTYYMLKLVFFKKMIFMITERRQKDKWTQK